MEYKFIELPDFFENYEERTSPKMKLFLEWFIAMVPERNIFLQEYVKNQTDIDLDFTPESLDPLWNWYITQINTHQELEDTLSVEYIHKFLRINRLEVDEPKLNTYTLNLILDIAMYFGEVYIRNFDESELYWGYRKGRKIRGEHNEPAIICKDDAQHSEITVLKNVSILSLKYTTRSLKHNKSFLDLYNRNMEMLKNRFSNKSGNERKKSINMSAIEWLDFSMVITDYKKSLFGTRRLKMYDKNSSGSFMIEIPKIEKKGISNKLLIKSIGDESDKFIKGLIKLFGMRKTNIKMRNQIFVEYLVLEGDINRIDVEEVKLKCFINDQELDIIVEFYLNIDIKESIVSMIEKDDAYRKDLIKVFVK